METPQSQISKEDEQKKMDISPTKIDEEEEEDDDDDNNDINMEQEERNKGNDEMGDKL